MRQAIALSLLFFASLTSCKSTEGHDRAADTADQVVMVGHCAGQTQLSLDKSLEALRKVDATREQEPTPAFKTFSSEFDSFREHFADLRKQRANLAAKAESWFSEFELKNAAIQDEDLREDGAKRLAEFREQVGETSKKVDELIKGGTDVEKNLGDLRTYLGNDLSPDGIKAASGKIDDAAKDGHKVAEKLGELSKASEALAEKLRAARKPEQPAK